ncbi:MAG: helix-turn-helix transcriptional regulator, partial [Cytophagales bacterium]|nr:helix-turn-helix transcriptional regulator [Armatimonadota bacterium]
MPKAAQPRATAVESPPLRRVSYRFETLRDRCENRPSAALPLLIWQDIVHGPGAQTANYHDDFCSLYVVRTGKGNHVINGTSFAIARGDVYAMGPGMFHHFTGCDRLTTDTLHFSPVIFDGEALTALSETPGFHSLFIAEPFGPDGDGRTAFRSRPAADQHERRWLHLTPTQYGATQAALAELYAEWRSKTLIGTLLARGLFFRLLTLLSRFHAENGGGGSGGDLTGFAPVYAGAHEATVAAAVRYLEEHFRAPLRVEQVAASVFLSPDRFTEVFAQGMGRTPRDYLRHLRVE